MKGLDSYKLDKAFTEGVEIRLDNAPDTVFLVKLPSQYNRGYTQALYSGVSFDFTESGVKTNSSLVEARHSQEDAFVGHCMISIDGESVPDGFAAEYPSAVAELIAKASDLAGAIDERVSDSVKKSLATSNGKGGGQGKSGSIQNLSEKAG